MAMFNKLSGLPLLVVITIMNSVSMAWFGYDRTAYPAQTRTTHR